MGVGMLHSTLDDGYSERASCCPLWRAGGGCIRPMLRERTGRRGNAGLQEGKGDGNVRQP